MFYLFDSKLQCFAQQQRVGLFTLSLTVFEHVIENSAIQKASPSSLQTVSGAL